MKWQSPHGIVEKKKNFYKEVLFLKRRKKRDGIKRDDSRLKETERDVKFSSLLLYIDMIL